MQYIFLIQYSLYRTFINFRGFCGEKNREITTLTKRMATRTNLSKLKISPNAKEIKYCENI